MHYKTKLICFIYENILIENIVLKLFSLSLISLFIYSFNKVHTLWISHWAYKTKNLKNKYNVRLSGFHYHLMSILKLYYLCMHYIWMFEIEYQK